MDLPFYNEAEFLALKRHNEFWAKRIADEKENPRPLVQLTAEEKQRAAQRRQQEAERAQLRKAKGKRRRSRPDYPKGGY